MSTHPTQNSWFLVVVYRRYIAQCRLKSVGFTTSRKMNSLRDIEKFKCGEPADTSTRHAASEQNLAVCCLSTLYSSRPKASRL